MAAALAHTQKLIQKCSWENNKRSMAEHRSFGGSDKYEAVYKQGTYRTC